MRHLLCVLLLVVACGRAGHPSVAAQRRLPPPVQYHNYVPNPSLEIADPGSNPPAPLGWEHQIYGETEAQYNYLNTGHFGNHAVNVTVTECESGNAGWRFHQVAVTPGQTYTFTDYYICNVPSQVLLAETKSDGSTYFPQIRDAAPSDQWNRYSATFTVDADVVSIDVRHIITSPGSLTTDDLSLVQEAPSFTRPLISVTFDDSFQSAYDNAFPLLTQYGVASTHYVISGLLEQPGRLTVDELLEMKAAGCEIGSHTVTHPDLTVISQPDLDNEVDDSERTISSDIASTVTDFAVPYGRYNDQVLSSIRHQYSSNRTTDEGYNEKLGFDPYRIKIKYMTSEATMTQFRSWVAACASSRTWLVVVYHKVDSSGWFYSIPRAAFEAQMQIIAQSGIHTCTVKDALAEIQPQL